MGLSKVKAAEAWASLIDHGWHLLLGLVVCTAAVCFYLSGVNTKFQKSNEQQDRIQSSQKMLYKHICIHDEEQRQFDKSLRESTRWIEHQLGGSYAEAPVLPDLPDGEGDCPSIYQKQGMENYNRQTSGISAAFIYNVTEP